MTTDTNIRTCGESSDRCKECCLALPVLREDRTIFKEACSPCKYQTQGGCAIYGRADWPNGCRKYFCGYILDDHLLGPHQRPDKTGVVPTWLKMDEDAGLERLVLLSESRNNAFLSREGKEVIALYLRHTGIVRLCTMRQKEKLLIDESRQDACTEAYKEGCELSGIPVYLTSPNHVEIFGP